MGYESKYTVEQGEYLSYDCGGISLRGHGKSEKINKFLTQEAVFLATDVFWGGRASPNLTVNLGDHVFWGGEPEDVRWCVVDGEAKYKESVIKYEKLLKEYEEEELIKARNKDLKMLKTLLDKYGIPEGYIQ